MNDLYQDQIIDAAQHPEFYGEMPDADRVIQAANASCGDTLTLYLKFEQHDPRQKITHLSWTGRGCVISQASMSVLASKINHEQLSLDQIADLNQDSLESMLGIDNISLGRVKCLMLGLYNLQHS